MSSNFQASRRHSKQLSEVSRPHVPWRSQARDGTVCGRASRGAEGFAVTPRHRCWGTPPPTNAASLSVRHANCAISFFSWAYYCSVLEISFLIERLSPIRHVLKVRIVFLLFMWLYIFMNRYLPFPTHVLFAARLVPAASVSRLERCAGDAQAPGPSPTTPAAPPAGVGSPVFLKEPRQRAKRSAVNHQREAISIVTAGSRGPGVADSEVSGCGSDTPGATSRRWEAACHGPAARETPGAVDGGPGSLGASGIPVPNTDGLTSVLRVLLRESREMGV